MGFISKPENGPPLQLNGLTKRYRLPWKRETVCALNHLDLEIQQGEIFGLLGPNGSGKSTSLKIILGLIRATAGNVKLFGQSSLTLATRRRIGFLPENPHFYKFLTGKETLYFFGKLCGIPKNLLLHRIDELLKLVGLEQAHHRLLSAYSKGMLQRIGLAQALLHEPELLLLDEPTAGVDPIGIREIKDLILHLKKNGKTIVLCSHLLEQAEEVCDRVAILYKGEKILEGCLEHLLTSKELCEITIQGYRTEMESVLRESLSQKNLQLIEVKKTRLSLESLFIQHIAQATKNTVFSEHDRP